MATPFEIATRAALQDIVKRHGQPSKFGIFFTDDALESLNHELYELLVTSRTLKQAGDRMTMGQPARRPAATARPQERASFRPTE